MGKDARTMSEAWSLWDRIWADTRIVFLPEPDDIEPLLSGENLPTSAQIND